MLTYNNFSKIIISKKGLLFAKSICRKNEKSLSGFKFFEKDLKTFDDANVFLNVTLAKEKDFFQGSDNLVNVIAMDSFFKVSVLELDRLEGTKNEKKEFVKWQSAKASFIEVENVVCDYDLLSINEDGRAKVLSIISNEKDIKNLTETLNSCDIEIETICPMSIALFNKVAKEENNSGLQNTFLIVLSEAFFTVIIVKDGIIDFIRSKVFSDRETLIRDISSSFSFYFDKNENFQFEKGFASPAKSFKDIDLKEALHLEVEYLYSKNESDVEDLKDLENTVAILAL